MTRKAWMAGRRWVALVAAYGLLLQSVLTGLIAAPALADGGLGALFVICHSGGPSPTPEDETRHHEVPCCALCATSGDGASALPPEGPVLPALAWRVSSPAWPQSATQLRSAGRGRQWARGPPGA